MGETIEKRLELFIKEKLKSKDLGYLIISGDREFEQEAIDNIKNDWKSFNESNDNKSEK